MKIVKSRNFYIVLVVIAVVLLAVFSLRVLNTTSISETESETNQAETTNESVDTVSSTMVIGSEDAPVTIVEYADFLCPYCAQYAREVAPQIKKDYVDTGKVRFEFRPMSYLTEDSSRAAELAFCTDDQGKFWEFHDYIYDKTWNDFYSKGMRPSDVELFSDNYVSDIADSIQADSEKLQACVDDGTHVVTVGDANQKAQENGVSGTPHFIINDKPYSGFAPYPVIKTTIESFL